MEVTGADCLPNDVPIHAAAHLLYLHRLHDIEELRFYFANFLQRLGVDKVFLGPLGIILVALPLLIDI